MPESKPLAPPPEAFRHLLIDRAPVPYREDTENFSPPVDGVDEAESPDPEFPQTLELAPERLAMRGVKAQGANRRLDATLDFRGQVPDDRGDVGRNVRAVARHQRPRFRAGRSGSPNTSSNESPFPPAA